MLKEYHQAYEEFCWQEQTNSSGYLVLIDNQVFYFPTKKDYESSQTNYPKHKQRFLAVDLDKWKNRLAEKINK